MENTDGASRLKEASSPSRPTFLPPCFGRDRTVSSAAQLIAHAFLATHPSEQGAPPKPAAGDLHMSDARIIEIEGEDAGIVVGDEHGFMFFAAKAAYYPFERATFRTTREAEIAIARFASERRACPPGRRSPRLA
jgi:hypothetical protein